MYKTRIDEIRWVSTDPHFGHDKLRKIARPQFSSLKEMHKEIVDRHNERVSPQDVIIMLGDMGFKDAIKENLPKMNGYKILILGNHDNFSKDFYREYFDEVYDHPLYYHRRIVFSHTPEKVSPGTINVHGHLHDLKLNSKQHFNACPEVQGYTPISIKKIERMMSIIPKENIHFLQEWWAEIQIPMPTHKNRGMVLKTDGTIDAAKSQRMLGMIKQYTKQGKNNEDILDTLRYKYPDLKFY